MLGYRVKTGKIITQSIKTEKIFSKPPYSGTESRQEKCLSRTCVRIQPDDRESTQELGFRRSFPPASACISPGTNRYYLYIYIYPPLNICRSERFFRQSPGSLHTPSAILGRGEISRTQILALGHPRGAGGCARTKSSPIPP